MELLNAIVYLRVLNLKILIKNKFAGENFFIKQITFRLKTGDWPGFCWIIGWLLTIASIGAGLGMVALFGLQV